MDIANYAYRNVDTNANFAPRGQIVGGLQQGAIDNATNQWIDSPGWGTDDWFYINNVAHYVNMNVLQPNPPSYIIGAALFLFENRIALQTSTGFSKLG